MLCDANSSDMLYSPDMCCMTYLHAIQIMTLLLCEHGLQHKPAGHAEKHMLLSFRIAVALDIPIIVLLLA